MSDASELDESGLQRAYLFYKKLLEILAGAGSILTAVLFIIGVGGIPLAIVATATTVLLLIVLLGRAFLLHSEPVSSIGAWREGYVSAEVNQNTPVQVGPKREQDESAPQFRSVPTALELFPDPKTLREFFRVDFHNWLALHQPITIQLKLQSEQGEILAQDEVKGCEVLLLADHHGKSEFLALYVPHHARIEEVCETFTDTYKTVLDLFKQNVQADMYFLGEHAVGLGDLHFTGQVYIYHESPLSVEAKQRIRELYKQKGLSVMFRGNEYLQQRLIQFRKK